MKIGVLAGLAAIGTLAVLWTLMLAAAGAHDAMSDDMMMGGMGGMGHMDGMMESMMGGGTQAETTGSASGQGTVQIEDFAFQPTTFLITPGTVVTWTNEDDAPHTATARDESFDSGRLQEGDRFAMTFNRAGTFAYICDLHPWMEGSIVVQ